MSWLTDYLAYTARQESPEIFHTWSGITAIAATLGRNVWLDRRSGGVTRYRIYPGQIMTLLVAGSGRSRKSVGIGQIKPFMKIIKKPIISGKSSAEAFLKQMDPTKGGYPQAILVESEITVFLTKGNYSEQLVDVMLDIADAGDEFVFNTITHGKIVIPQPCLTALMASTPENLGDGLPTKAQSSGWLARVIVVYSRTTDRVEPLSDVEDTDITAAELAEIKLIESRLKAGIADFGRMAGPFRYTPKGKEWFDTWYRKWVESPAGSGEGWPAKRQDHLLRVAMVIAASKKEMHLDEKSLAAADKLLYIIEQNFDKALAFVGTNYAKDRQRIIDFITLKAGKATTPEILSTLYPYFPDIEVLRRTLRLLADVGVLKYEVTKTSPAVETWSLVGLDFTL